MIKKAQHNIGILGGTFDPPHKGHLYISRIAIRNLKLQKLLWSITKQNPLKKTKPSKIERERLQLCKAIVKKEKKIYILNTDDIKNSDFTINIIKAIKKNVRKECQLFFIIGADNLINFHLWKSYEKIFELSTVIVMNRPGHKKLALQSLVAQQFATTQINLSALQKRKLKKKEWVYVNNRGINVSSSKLRISLYK